ncbi:transglutaminase domain-containing protein [Polaribacter sp. BAL334]|uniref:transglutaminase-like domain-containing protein n=1 Tax=Polaribacter sp. BAL334 TaxID=1708178 RepID=UPI0018D262E5|nr:transglutaminase-like domain-containing protein [Polaribacter sp. BAL334]MBG7613172.1 transglutaminase domain-containing protein [Polaribacter sp. BAL334]
MKYKLIITISLIISSFIFNSCSSCSRSGRSKIIAMAKSEASKKNTIPEPNTIIKKSEPQIINIEDIVSPNEKNRINEELIKSKIPPVIGNLIQVEGLVLKEVSELNIKLNTSGSQLEQILAMQNYVFKNWHYIFDPITGKDTWRSAEATLSLKYNDQYSGDCDDFAILMASMARQIGLKSRMIGGFDDESGHAFAEFLLPEEELSNELLNGLDFRKDSLGIWVSLDWFKGENHKKFTKNIIIYENI